MPSLPFKQVDVVTHQRFKGNPVAVIAGKPVTCIDGTMKA